MKTIKITKGFDIKLEGEPETKLITLDYQGETAVCLRDFPGLKPRLMIKEGDSLKAGETLFIDKINPYTRFPAPYNLRLKQVIRGARNFPDYLVFDQVNTDIKQYSETFDRSSIKTASREELSDLFKNSGLIYFFRERPFNQIPLHHNLPQVLFINAMSTEPLTQDISWLIERNLDLFLLALGFLERIFCRKIFLCTQNFIDTGKSEYIEQVVFSGPHPSGLTGTHISYLFPFASEDRIWELKAADLLEIGFYLAEGHMPFKSIITLAGEIEKPASYEVLKGSPLKIFSDICQSKRPVKGTVLWGEPLNQNDYLGFFQRDLQFISDFKDNRLFNWMLPVNHKEKNSTMMHGDERAIIWQDIYDKVTPLKTYTSYLMKALLAKDWEAAVDLGVLAFAPEDFSLATWICPSKVDCSRILRKGIEDMRREHFQ